MVTPLASVAIRGFRSIADLDLPLTSDVTLLIGANGSGKSNIVDAFELLGRTMDSALQAAVITSGGFGQLLHRGITGTAHNDIELSAWGMPNAVSGGHTISNGYKMRLAAAPDDRALLNETTYSHRSDYAEPFDNQYGPRFETVLPEIREEHAANGYLLEILTGCRVFHFDDTSADAPPLQRADVADGLSLHSNARNLAAVLLRTRQWHPEAYGRIRRSIQVAAPFFRDFILEPDGGTVLLRWQEQGIDGTFSGSALSSGTLRFICLATLLQQPSPPATIVLDEPELGLHPAAIRQLAELFRLVGRDHRVIAATQSISLLECFSVDEIAIVERVNGTTTLERPKAARLEAWLEEYSLGDLWEMNLLGGQPRPAAANRRTW